MPSRQALANAIRVLSMDAVKRANSGHSGMPMGMADIAEVLWNHCLKHNPKNPHWVNRDRFILSNGHGSMLLYALLHLTGYDLSMEDIRQFRQLHAKTPGHPEYGLAPGVETTTGPLGQGFANAVGMAIAERTLAAEFNQSGHTVIDHRTYVFLGDGCLMEGISHEAASLAGTLGLGKLIAIWDDNGISIDGKVAGWCRDNVPQRFEAYGWHVIPIVDGHDAAAIHQAILAAQQETNRPSLICCQTQIAYGAPTLAGTNEAHGAITATEEIEATKKNFGWTYPPFEIPNDIYQAWDATEKGAAWENEWQIQWRAYEAAYPVLAQELIRRLRGELPANWKTHASTTLKQLVKSAKEMPTRKAFQVSLNALGEILPELLGGSADLTESNCTFLKQSRAITPTEHRGNYLFYGVREFGMSAIMNGIALHGGFLPYGGTFLTFLDYARNAVRMSALMRQRVIFIYTHDSIGLGEDGPTHQPIEHINMLRMTPNMSVWRPCDLAETVVAMQFAIERRDGPTALLLTRQNTRPVERDETQLMGIYRGAYILKDGEGPLDAIIIATGSEVGLALEAATLLAEQGKHVRVVSMPSMDVFEQQELAYRQHILPDSVRTRIAVEAGNGAMWYRYVGLSGAVIGLSRFGESAPAKVLYDYFGLTVTNIVDTVLTHIRKNGDKYD